MTPFLFVYGTLRSEFSNDFSLRLRAAATLIGTARVAGRLYRLDGYPGLRLTPVEPADRVTGEVYRLNDPATLFPALDVYEGCGPDDPEPHEYQRVVTDAKLLDGTRVDAWVYVYRRDVAEDRRIASGDFAAGGLS